MSRQRYTEEFKIEAVKQVTERGHPIAEVAARLGVSGYSPYQWIKRYAKLAEHRQQNADLQAENRRLKAELKRVSEERDILKKATVGMPPRTSPESPTKVRVYPRPCGPIPGAAPVPHDGGASQRPLSLVP
ncbi:hypothetical protein GCM10007159_39960 [Modicisalibacter luteus]|nr:hypothetical protein GCM10007159_39960 [Halomonas lutea]